MSVKQKYIDEIVKSISISLHNLKVEDNNPSYEIPPSMQMGNLAFPMFKYSKELKQNPAEIASEVESSAKFTDIVESTEVKGPYLNIFFNRNKVANDLLNKILNEKENFGKQKKNKQKVVVEFSCPNTNKPLHLGHCRNNVLGDSISKILDYNGYEVRKVNLINDRGIHICKSMLAYKKYGNDTTPEKENKKSDHLVGDFYVKYAQEAESDNSLETEAQGMLQLWEKDDEKVRALWEKMNKWAIDGIKETYKRMDIVFDNYEYESINYLYGKEIVEEGLKKKVFYKNEDNSVWINNEDVGLDKKIILRNDGTSIYITQDLGTSVKRHEKYGFDEMIYVVGAEQEYHFKTLFAVLKKLNYKWAEKCRHLSYGMVNLPDGKMKSREGNVVDADNLIGLLYEMALKELDERKREINNNEKKEIANKVSLAALKYYLLNFSTSKDVMFMPEQSISFDGNTGPYLQYTTARLNSLFVKSKDVKKDKNTNINENKINDDEWGLLLQLLDFEDVINKCSISLEPVELCNFLYNLARLYNKFYHDNPILRADSFASVNFRLELSNAVNIILKTGMYLIGIDSLKKM